MSDRGLSHAQKRDIVVLGKESLSCGGAVAAAASKSHGNARRMLTRLGMLRSRYRGGLEYVELTKAGWNAYHALTATTPAPTLTP